VPIPTVTRGLSFKDVSKRLVILTYGGRAYVYGANIVDYVASDLRIKKPMCSLVLEKQIMINQEMYIHDTSNEHKIRSP
jgi:hypothetical protein